MDLKLKLRVNFVNCLVLLMIHLRYDSVESTSTYTIQNDTIPSDLFKTIPGEVTETFTTSTLDSFNIATTGSTIDKQVKHTTVSKSGSTTPSPISADGYIKWPKKTDNRYEKQLAHNRQALETVLIKRASKMRGSGHTHPPPLGSRVVEFTQEHGIVFQKFVTDVSILVYVTRIDYMDMNSQSLTFAALVNLTWWDLSLTWDPTKDSPLKQIMMDITDIWNPYVLPDDIQDFVFIPDNNQVNNKANKVIVQYNGLCDNTFWATFTVPCDVNVMTFPFDTHRCHLRLSQMINWAEEINWVSVKFENNSNTRTKLFNQRHKHKEWELISISGRVIEKGLTYSLKIDLRRKSVFYAVVLIMPCIILNLLSFLIFIVPVEGTERIDLALNLIISYFVLLMIMTGSLPPTGGKVPLLGMYLTISTAIVLLNLMCSLILMYLNKMKDMCEDVPSMLTCFERPLKFSSLKLKLKCLCKQNIEEEVDDHTEVNHHKHKLGVGLGASIDIHEDDNLSDALAKTKFDHVIYNLNILFFCITLLIHTILVVTLCVEWKELWFV